MPDGQNYNVGGQLIVLDAATAAATVNVEVDAVDFAEIVFDGALLTQDTTVNITGLKNMPIGAQLQIRWAGAFDIVHGTGFFTNTVTGAGATGKWNILSYYYDGTAFVQKAKWSGADV